MRSMEMTKRGFCLLMLGLSALLVTAGSVDAAEKELLRYRHAKGGAVHLPNEKTAKSYEASLKSLGIEAKVFAHGDHFDLSYTCPQWREATFDAHDTVHKWEKFLKSLGFETEHKH